MNPWPEKKNTLRVYKRVGTMCIKWRGSGSTGKGAILSKNYRSFIIFSIKVRLAIVSYRLFLIHLCYWRVSQMTCISYEVLNTAKHGSGSSNCIVVLLLLTVVHWGTSSRRPVFDDEQDNKATQVNGSELHTCSYVTVYIKF